MTDKDRLAERGRALEDDYFRKRDQELVEKMRRAPPPSRGAPNWGSGWGSRTRRCSGSSRRWASRRRPWSCCRSCPRCRWRGPRAASAPPSGSCSCSSRAAGVEAGSAADRTLAQWLAARPGEEVFAHATRLIRAMLAAPGALDLTADELVGHSEAIAAASGGLLGRNRVSAEERRLLTALADELKARSG